MELTLLFMQAHSCVAFYKHFLMTTVLYGISELKPKPKYPNFTGEKYTTSAGDIYNEM